MTLIYHTFLREFQGATAAEVVDQLYLESKSGLEPEGATPAQEFTRQAWWEHQDRLLSRFGQVAPHIHAPDANERLLEALLGIHAIEAGPMEPRKPGLP